MKDKNFKFYIKVVEALLFSSSEPVKDHVIASKLPDTIDSNKVMKEISEFYKDRGIECLRINDSWAFRTSKDVSDYLDVERVVTKPLSRPALETLSIIAYHQPVTRSEIEAIRGVGVARGTIDILLELEVILQISYFKNIHSKKLQLRTWIQSLTWKYRKKLNKYLIKYI